MQPDGRILISGFSAGGSFSTESFVLARYLSGLHITGLGLTAGPQISIVVRPNPTSGEFTLKYELPVAGKVSVDLYDMQGRLVQHFFSDIYRPVGVNMEYLNLQSDITPGSYVLSVSGLQFSRSIRVIRQ
jgi:hypothetical protein